MGISLSLDLGSTCTATPMTKREGSNFRQIAVNTLINAASGALVAWIVTKQSPLNGALIGATITIFQATVGAAFCDLVSGEGGFSAVYSAPIGVLLTAYTFTFWRGGGMANFRTNVIYFAAIKLFTPVLPAAIARITGIKI